MFISADEWHHGNEPIKERLNIAREIKLFKENPLEAFLAKINPDSKSSIWYDDISRYRAAYSNYFFSIVRFIKETSLIIRWDRSAGNKLRHRLKYKERDRWLSRNYHSIQPYIEVDFFNVLIHSRILCDRTISLSRYFLKMHKQPSYTSFYEHKKFFVRYSKYNFGQHEAYAKYMREQTNWFDMPLKPVRDKFIVHAGPVHMRFLGFQSDYDLLMVVYIPRKEATSHSPKHDIISISIRRLARDIKNFLNWYNRYGVKCIA